ncbi:MAG: 2-oxoacid:acceptor oxidoreductase subunit alpha [Deltaproteobacteria bacterium]|nr:MAG: 2-oxoacid:acceptor oxidoreductase subunit alpha [Deltaproteobacteria bacterium]
MATPSATPKHVTPQCVDDVVIRFAGDSGDGMQLTGTQFTNTSAIVGNDLATLPDFPAEIRAPAGTLAGVSGFQINFSSHEVFTPGDELDVLVAMNPAALKQNIGALKRGGLLIVNTGGFKPKNLALAGYETNPLEDGSLSNYQVVALDISGMTAEALKDTGLSAREIERCKNFFTLGLLYWLYSRPLEPTLHWIEQKFRGKPQLIEANAKALKAGYAYGETAEIFHVRYEVPPRTGVKPGTYTNLTGNRALALGMVAASQKCGLPLFLGSYPITPASDLLHELSRLKEFGVVTFQAEDEIAAICATIGAAFGGQLALTSTSGPGLALKGEALGLAIMTELPIVVANIQRGGPSTGLPTKTEQADLLQAMYGRNGEAPCVVIAAKTPGDCFYAAIEAARIATKYMTPVVLLSDGYLANGAEPWRIPELDEIPGFEVHFRTDPEGFTPYLRDEKTLARPWAIPGTPGLEHRIGGLEKQHITGGVSYDPKNHEFMVKLRAEKVARVADDIPDAEVIGDTKGKLLVVGWGSTYGAIAAAVERSRNKGLDVSHLHLRHINPWPKNVGPMIESFEHVLVPEMNNGQLVRLLRAAFGRDHIRGLNKIQGLPFKTSEIEAGIREVLG